MNASPRKSATPIFSRLVVAAGTVCQGEKTALDPFHGGGGASAYEPGAGRQRCPAYQRARSAWAGGGRACHCRHLCIGETASGSRPLSSAAPLGANRDVG